MAIGLILLVGRLSCGEGGVMLRVQVTWGMNIACLVVVAPWNPQCLYGHGPICVRCGQGVPWLPGCADS